MWYSQTGFQGGCLSSLGKLRIASLFFADDMVPLASSDRKLQPALGQFAAKYEAVRMRISTSASEAMAVCQKTLDCSHWVGGGGEYLWVLSTSEERMEQEMEKQIGAVSINEGIVVVQRD